MTDRDKVTMVIDDLLKYKTDKDRIKTIDWIIEFANRQKQGQDLLLDSVSGSFTEWYNNGFKDGVAHRTLKCKCGKK